MAEFRKIFYALAMVALLAGLSAPAFGQECDAGSVVPPDVRGEGRAELVGDILIRCTGGVPTPPGQIVPSVNIRVQLNTFITSQLLNGSGNPETEVLLIVDEPNSGRYAPNVMAAGQTGERPLLACGQSGAPDTSPSGPNVCRIIAPNHPSRTYDGLANGYNGINNDGSSLECGDEGTPAEGSFGCGRPNVFQGHYVGSVLSGRNIVEFSGVPFDPPGSAQFNSGLDAGNPNRVPWVRTFRIVNIRVDASSTSATDILANVSFSGDTQASIDDANDILVGRNRFDAFINPEVSGEAEFVQCIERELDSLDGIRSNPRSFPDVFIRFTEGFEEAWKTRGWAEVQVNSDGGNANTPGSYGAYDESFQVPSAIVRQNVPGAIYHTESGFTAPSNASDPAGQNPPPGTGFQLTPFTDQFIANSTGITGAGVATNGTRLQILFNNIPTGVTLYTPGVVYLTRAGTEVVTGIAVRNGNVDPVNGPLTNTTLSNGAETWVQVPTSRLAVYEMLYVDPFAEEDLTVPIGITTNLSQLPQSISTATTVRGGLAPVGTAILPLVSSVSNGRLPRFVENLQGDDTLFTLEKCNCNLLFPFVSNAAGFDTGIAIANTSLSPTDSTFTQTLAQSGPIQFWYFANGALARTECTNTTTKGQCPGTTFVPAGGVMSFTLFGGSNTWGLNGAPTGFTGYMIAKTGFQYCHGFAYFSDLGRTVIPNQYGTSVGYLALVMDPTSFAGLIDLNPETGNGFVIMRKTSPRTTNLVSDGLDQ